MANPAKVVGITDGGQLLVMPEHACEHYRPGADRLIASRTCWYCSWADFRKSTEISLTQSICRCPCNRVSVVHGSKNEAL